MNLSIFSFYFKGHFYKKIDLKTVFLVRLLFLSALLCASSCQKLQRDQLPNGSVAVQIPVSTVSESSEPNYELKVVTLKNINTLSELRGQYAQFFYAPGLNDNSLVGVSPLAYFIKTAKSIFVPKDETSLHMATLYYHVQNLTDFAQGIGINSFFNKPFEIGIKTQVNDNSGLQFNNAFYDGRSDAMLFVPYTNKHLPISVNAGIIAHEFFHAIFYKSVFAKIKWSVPLSQKISFDTAHIYESNWLNLDSDIDENKTIQDLYNETYLRGLNEGLADFWAWLYTNDPDFLKWSLPTHVEARTLKKQQKVTTVSAEKLMNLVEQSIMVAEKPSQYLSQFIYSVGTPYARYLKNYIELELQKNNADEAKVKDLVAKKLMSFLKQMTEDATKLTNNEVLAVDSLYFYFADNKNKSVSKEQCDLAVQYINSQSAEQIYKCETNDDGKSYEVIKL